LAGKGGKEGGSEGDRGVHTAPAAWMGSRFGAGNLVQGKALGRIAEGSWAVEGQGCTHREMGDTGFENQKGRRGETDINAGGTTGKQDEGMQGGGNQGPGREGAQCCSEQAETRKGTEVGTGRTVTPREEEEVRVVARRGGTKGHSRGGGGRVRGRKGGEGASGEGRTREDEGAKEVRRRRDERSLGPRLQGGGTGVAGTRGVGEPEPDAGEDPRSRASPPEGERQNLQAHLLYYLDADPQRHGCKPPRQAGCRGLRRGS